jgi:hypothetical protein
VLCTLKDMCLSVILYAAEWLIPATELCTACYSFSEAYTEACLHTVFLVDNKEGGIILWGW